MATVTYSWSTAADPIFVNDELTAGDQQGPAVAGLRDGRYFAAWDDPSGEFSVHGRVLNSDGVPVGSEFPVNSTDLSTQFDPSVAQLENGNVVVTFTDRSSVDPGGDLRARLFSPDGAQLGPDFELVTGVTDDSLSDVTALTDGGFVVSWSRNHDGNFTLAHQVFNADGTERSALFDLNTPLGGRSSVASLADGGYLLVFEVSDHRVFVQPHNAEGFALSTVQIDGPQGSNADVQVVVLKDGGFAVAYTEEDAGTSGQDITLQIFNADGTARTDYLRPNLHNVGAQDSATLTVLSNGYIVVGWRNGANLVYQAYTPEGEAVGANFAAANRIVEGEIAGLTGGLVANVHSSAVSDGDGRSMRTSVHELTRTITADSAGEVLQGDGLSDTIVAVNGNNTLIGGGGDDTLIGGRDVDTAVFAGTLSAHAIEWSGATITLNSAGEGFDTTHGIERFQFADGTVTQNDGNARVDDLFYLSRNLDVWDTHREAEAHYNELGWTQGRDPNAFFSTNGYVSANGDVKVANTNPLEHYHLLGWLEGRDASASFDTELYLIFNPDVANAHVDPLEHFLQYGREEGRTAHAAVGRNLAGDFDAEFYLLSNPDVGLAGADPLAHFDMFGRHEGRDPNAFFDTDGYLAGNPDVAAAGVNPLDHFHQFGWKEGRDPSGAFDTDAYLAAYADVAAANVDPLEHFLKFGVYEGRSAFGDGVIA